MIKINMFSHATKIMGQGVGSAYIELIKSLKKNGHNKFEISLNSYKKADITHYHTINPTFFLSTLFSKNRGIKVGHVHFLPDTIDGSLRLPKLPKFFFDKYLVLFYKRMDKLVVVNPTFIDKLVDLGISKDKIEYIPNFVNSVNFRKVSQLEKTEFRLKKNIGQENFIVLGVGQIQQRKGIDDFIELAIRNPEIQFIWAGGFSFGKITAGYEKYSCIFHNPPKNLMFTGIIERDELVSYYNIADIFLLPSFNELFPMSILEAINCETPVMLRNLDVYKDIFKDGYISANDLNEMEEKIKYYLNNKNDLKYFESKSKGLAEKYSENAVYKIWENYYENLIK